MAPTKCPISLNGDHHSAHYFLFFYIACLPLYPPVVGSWSGQAFSTVKRLTANAGCQIADGHM